MIDSLKWEIIEFEVLWCVDFVERRREAFIHQIDKALRRR
jgi:hypothetical protein